MSIPMLMGCTTENADIRLCKEGVLLRLRAPATAEFVEVDQAGRWERLFTEDDSMTLAVMEKEFGPPLQQWGPKIVREILELQRRYARR